MDDPAEHIWAYGERLRTWGQWGDDDEKGAVNLITDERRAAAARLARRGAVFSLALPLRNGKGPMVGLAGRFNPIHHMTATGEPDGLRFELGATAGVTDGVLAMPLQGSTQWDSLSHVYYHGEIYNGYDAATVTSKGAARAGIDKVARDLVGRGVLLDVPRWRGIETLGPGEAIMPADLTACARHQGTEVSEGDILLVRTGAMTRVVGDDWTAFHATPRPGLHYTAAEWLGAHGVAAVAADNNGVEAPSPLPGVRSPLHMVALRDMGIHLGEFWHLEELAEDCSADGVYEFLLVAQPLPVEGGTGSPVNPLAIK